MTAVNYFEKDKSQGNNINTVQVNKNSAMTKNFV